MGERDELLEEVPLTRNPPIAEHAEFKTWNFNTKGLHALNEYLVSKERLWLIPTAEVPLTNLVRESILSEDELPLRFTALTPCFRSEAGSAGRDTRGMLRQHQFDKVELVSITTPEKSLEEHERMTVCAEEVLEAARPRLSRHGAFHRRHGFRRAEDLRPGSLAAGAEGVPRNLLLLRLRRFPGAADGRRASRARADKQPRFVHTLNGSGVAVGRALIAVMETYQNEDGSITVPDALRPYMRGVEKIEA